MIQIERLLRPLIQADLRFMVIGGMAAVIHGASTTTQDLDVSIAMTPEEIRKLREALRDLHPVHRMTPQALSFLEFPESLTGIRNLYLRTDSGVLDVVGDLSLVGDFETLYARSEKYELLGSVVHVIALQDLITLKARVGREKDLYVVKELELILKARSS